MKTMVTYPAGRKKVFICSPYRPNGNTIREKQNDLNYNRWLAKNACEYALEQGCLPMAPHLYFTQFLPDEDDKQREIGIRFGLDWLKGCDELWVIGKNISEGMRREIVFANLMDIPVIHLVPTGDCNHGHCFGRDCRSVGGDCGYGKHFTVDRTYRDYDCGYDCGYEDESEYDATFADDDEEGLLYDGD